MLYKRHYRSWSSILNSIINYLSHLKYVHLTSLKLSFLVKSPITLSWFCNFKKEHMLSLIASLSCYLRKIVIKCILRQYGIFHLYVVIVCSKDNAFKREREKIYLMLKKLKMENQRVLH